VRKLFLVVGALGAALAALVVAWRRNPRMGTRFTNDVVNPALLRRGLAGVGKSELGTLEHVGRRTGTRHLTPIHPVPTDDGFRIVVPLGPQSQWAQNVLAAGHCRLQLHDTVYDLDEPVLLAASELPDIAAPVARIQDLLGVQYLLLRRCAEQPGALEPPAQEPAVGPSESPEPVGAGAS
jgi:deazaflavin-dependent oxidoreductase (nitroreductase family)